ncbi:hypothetical protein [Bacteroides acidifaciens]|uniref:hypothetical protein n=1 Tax=Bacteroides acidifaciens TaxID=85831 RepID=UPI0025954551|nr:hypothetical protein [Bacteroides acidifaciens]
MKRKGLISMCFAAMVAIVAIVVSCQKESAPKEPTDIYEQIGKLHNEGLEFAFTYINAAQTKAGAKLTREQALVKGQESLDVFLAKHGITSVVTKSGIDEFKDYDGQGLNEKQKKYYDELIETVLNPTLDYDNTQLAIDYIRNSIVRSLPSQDAEVLLYGIAVAKYSLEYWYKNTDKWTVAGAGLDAIAYSVTTKGQNPEGDDGLDWKEVAKGDVAGAVGGALVGAAGGGVGAGPGALAGGLGGSIVSGIGELWDWIFN